MSDFFVPKQFSEMIRDPNLTVEQVEEIKEKILSHLDDLEKRAERERKGWQTIVELLITRMDLLQDYMQRYHNYTREAIDHAKRTPNEYPIPKPPTMTYPKWMWEQERVEFMKLLKEPE